LSFSIEKTAADIVAVLDDPVLYAHVKDQHDKAVVAALEAIQKRAPRKKRKRAEAPEPSENIKADIQALQAKIDKIQLKSWS
jgi:hypothetical protein